MSDTSGLLQAIQVERERVQGKITTLEHLLTQLTQMEETYQKLADSEPSSTGPRAKGLVVSSNRITCPVAGCGEQLTSRTALSVHLSKRNTPGHKEAWARGAFRDIFPRAPQPRKPRQAVAPDLKKCPVPGCHHRTFKALQGRNVHLSRRHPNWLALHWKEYLTSGTQAYRRYEAAERQEQQANQKLNVGDPPASNGSSNGYPSLQDVEGQAIEDLLGKGAGE